MSSNATSSPLQIARVTNVSHGGKVAGGMQCCGVVRADTHLTCADTALLNCPL